MKEEQIEKFNQRDCYCLDEFISTFFPNSLIERSLGEHKNIGKICWSIASSPSLFFDVTFDNVEDSFSIKTYSLTRLLEVKLSTKSIFNGTIPKYEGKVDFLFLKRLFTFHKEIGEG